MRKKPIQDHLPMDVADSQELSRWYSMTEHQAMNATLKQHGEGSARMPIQKWLAAQELKYWQAKHAKGDKAAVLEGLYLCTLNDLPMPRWLVYAFLAAYRAIRQYEARTWDEVFGKPHKKGTHLAAKRDEREKAIQIYQRVKQIKATNPGTAIDEALFERVGDEFGVGRSTANEYYYKVKKRWQK